MRIADGTGNDYELGVNSKNQALTRSVTESVQLEAALDGDSYQVGSGVVVLTGVDESAILNVLNNDERNLIITGVNITSSTATGASASTFLAKVYLNGTGTTTGTAQSALNNNFGSNKSADLDIQVGAYQDSITSGDLSGAFYIPHDTFFNTDTAWILPKGASVGVTVTAPTGTTLLPVTITLEGHFE